MSADDLLLAAEWLREYEGDTGTPISAQDPADDDANQAALRRVAAWVDAEVARRSVERVARQLAAKAGASMRSARTRKAALTAARRLAGSAQA